MLEGVEAGGVFGKTALVEDRPRIGTAVVLSEASLVSIDRKRFEFPVQQAPFVSLQLTAAMAERLRRMNERA